VSWFTHPHVVPNLYEFLLLKIKEGILKDVGNQTVVAIDFHSLITKLFDYQHASKYIFCVKQKETHTGLESK